MRKQLRFFGGLGAWHAGIAVLLFVAVALLESVKYALVGIGTVALFLVSVDLWMRLLLPGTEGKASSQAVSAGQSGRRTRFASWQVLVPIVELVLIGAVGWYLSWKFAFTLASTGLVLVGGAASFSAFGLPLRYFEN